MCLALPYRVVALLDPGRALVEGPGGRREIDVSQMDAPTPGTFVLIAYSTAIREIPEDDAADLLAIWTELQASA